MLLKRKKRYERLNRVSNPIQKYKSEGGYTETHLHHQFISNTVDDGNTVRVGMEKPSGQRSVGGSERPAMLKSVKQSETNEENGSVEIGRLGKIPLWKCNLGNNSKQGAAEYLDTNSAVSLVYATY